VVASYRSRREFYDCGVPRDAGTGAPIYVAFNGVGKPMIKLFVESLRTEI
jgi:hypothetical protein